MINFISTVNPFKLPDPPQWWLTQLSDYDSQLVVFPSKIRPAYILARRRQATNAFETMVALDKDLLRKSAGMDGDVLADHNLIYVRHLLGDSVRRPAIFQWLRDHDMQRAGGAEKFANLIESEEDYKARMSRRKMIEDIDHRARDAYRSYQARTGQRTRVGGQSRPSAKQMPVGKFSPKESSVASFVRD